MNNLAKKISISKVEKRMLIPKNPSSVLRALHLEVVYFTFAGVEAEAEAEDPETEKEGERKEARD